MKWMKKHALEYKQVSIESVKNSIRLKANAEAWPASCR